MKKLARPLSFLLIFALLFSVSCSISMGTKITYDDPASYSVGDAELSGEVNILDIEWPAGWVSIRTYKGTTVKIEDPDGGDSENHRLRYRLRNGTLTVKEFASGASFHGKDVQKKLSVLIPESAGGYELSALTCEAVSADVYVTDLGMQTARVSTTSGDISFSGAAETSAMLYTVSGDIDLFFSTPELRANTVSGNVSGSLLSTDAEIETVSGDVSINGNSTSLSIHTISGDVSLDAVTERLSVETTSGTLSLSGTHDDVTFSTVSGDCTGTGTVRALKFDSSSGTLSLTSDCLPKSLRCTTASGNISISAPAETVGCRVTASSDSGTCVVTDPEISHDLSGDEYRWGNFTYEYRLHSTSGNISLRLTPVE